MLNTNNDQSITQDGVTGRPMVSPLESVQLVKGRIMHTRVMAGLLLPLLIFTSPLWINDAWTAEGFEWAGCVAILLCVLGRIWCAAYITGRKKKVVVDAGPYSVSRNPLYAFSFIGVIGIGLLTGSITWLVFLTILFILYYRVIVRREEQFLLATLGKEYRLYYERTPRWFPDPKLWRDAAEVTLSPALLMRAVRDAACFFLAFPVFEGLEYLHSSGIVPALLRLP